jgi:biotin carboxyl carrier protein
MKKLRITVGGKTYDVTVEVLGDDDAGRPQAAPIARAAAAAAPVPLPASAPPPPAAAPRHSTMAGAVTSPMAGTVKAVQVKVGDTVREGQVVVILDAM